MARPPLRHASRFCAVVPPWRGELPEPLALPPRRDAPGELAILAARSLDMPLSFKASYWFSFFTFADFDGIASSSIDGGPVASLGQVDSVGSR